MNFKLNKLSTVLLLLSTGSSIAGTMGPIVEDFNPKEGVYLGAGVSASINHNKFTTAAPTVANVINISANNTTALGNAFLGYGQTFLNNLYLGGEANLLTPRVAKFNRNGLIATSTAFENKYTIDNSFSLDLLPGYRLNSNVLVYGRVGMAFTNVSMNQQGVIIPEQAVADRANFVNGRFGAGITYGFSKHFAASVDYYYTYAPRFGTYSPILSSQQFDFKTSSNVIGVSLIYTI